jgi:UDP-2,3-diacylglucosamine pyrophosphatase LpxH
VTDFEVAVAAEARKAAGHDGVVCGHIHRAEMRDHRRHAVLQRWRLGGKPTALVEHHDGRLELVAWAQSRTVGQTQTVAPEVTS